MTNNCFIYCRVSTEEQADKGFSLDAQEKLCSEFAQSNGYKIIGVYRDEGKSGTTINRPALTEMLSRCNKDISLSAVIVQETDRLARNTKDHLTIKATLQKAKIKLISVAQPMLDDSPEGKMIDTILASVNQFQSDINSRKIRRGMQERFNQGWWPGWAPLGYINAEYEACSDDNRTVKTIKEDPKNWDLVREGLKLYLTGNYSADEVNDILYEKGLRSKYGKKIPHSVITMMLKNPYYAGIMRWNGQERQGKHKPMVTMQEHKRILQIMDTHNLHACRRRKHSFLLRGFVYCNQCGQRYTAETHPKKKVAYYHCSSRQHSNRKQHIEISVLERDVEECFKGLQFSKSFSNLLVDKLRMVYLEERENIDVKKQILYNQKKAIEIKRNKAEEKLLDGVISDDDFKRLRARFMKELSSIQEHIDDLDNQKELDLDSVYEILKLSRNIYLAYKGASYEVKRQYLALFWDKFLVENQKIVRAIPTDLIQSLHDTQKVIITMDWWPIPTLIQLLRNQEYMTTIKSQLSEIASYKKHRLK
ncbi:MAG: recombinase family protein [bacterium]|nr:recombinase family protein [bacterium]